MQPLRARPGAPPLPTLVVADGDRGVREALRSILATQYDVATATCRHGLSTLLTRSRVDVVVVDLRLPGGGGPWLSDLRRTHPDVAFVALATRVAVAEARDLLSAGIAELLPKPVDVADVAGAVSSAHLAQRQRSHLVGFLRALGRLVGSDRHVATILDSVEKDSPLRRQAGELVSWTARRMVRVDRSRAVDAARGGGSAPGSDELAVSSASAEGAWR